MILLIIIQLRYAFIESFEQLIKRKDLIPFLHISKTDIDKKNIVQKFNDMYVFGAETLSISLKVESLIVHF